MNICKNNSQTCVVGTIRCKMQKVYDQFDKPYDVPIFMCYIQGILQNLVQQGIDLPGAKPQEEEAWDICRQRSFATAEGRRCNTARFLGVTSTTCRRRPFWYIDLWEREFLALEEDMMGSKKFCQKVLLKGVGEAVVGEKGDTTGAKKNSMIDKTLRSCCQNAIVVSRMVLQEQNFFRLAGSFAFCLQIMLRHVDFIYVRNLVFVCVSITRI